MTNELGVRIAIARRKTNKIPILLAIGLKILDESEILDTLEIGEDTYELLQRDIKKAWEGDES